MNKYFVIRNSHGDTCVYECTKEELREALREKDYGDSGFINKIQNPDTNYWGDNILIVKGEIVSPKPVQVATEFDIE